jgi:RNA polymerase sigma factor (TIGR02999 family)
MTSAPGSDGRDDVTRLLAAIEEGEPHAAEALLPIVYDELRALAHQRMSREAPGQTIQATALVHEAYLRLMGTEERAAPPWANRAHFFSAAALAMRRILVERARRSGSARHGGAMRRVELADSAVVGAEEPPDTMDLDAALTRLQQLDERKYQVVMLRYFAGLSIEDAACALEVSPATAKNDWAFARAWLHRELARE